MDLEKVINLFRYDHLPEKLRAASSPFYELAVKVVAEIPECAERTLALRALWEAKNLAVWAAANV